MVRKIVIGDIHGCFNELMDLLELVAPADNDQIIAIGDIVDRGPDSEKVLEFFRDTPNAISIMGNHERKHIRSARGTVQPALSQRIVKAQLGSRYDEWLDFMETFTRHIELPEAILIHGMFEPGVSLEQQKDTVVIGTLTGEHYLEEQYAGPWYEHYDGAKPLIVGHHDYLGQGGPPLIHNDIVYGIDTGAAHGGRLTALILPEFQIVSVPSHGDHWTQQRRNYAVLAGSRRPNLQLDWETLTAFANSAGTEDLTAEQKDRATQCAKLVEECDRLIEDVLAYAKGSCGRIHEELCAADDWDACEPKKQAARFAQQAGKSPASQLLFAARSDKLDKAFIMQRLRRPCDLAQLAARLGINTSLHSGVQDKTDFERQDT